MTAALSPLRAVDSATRRPRSDKEMLERVRVYLSTHLDRGTPTLAQVAKDMACGARTLQRNLRRLDTSFVEVLAAVRRERYETLTRSDHRSEEDLARALGYSDARSLRRWRHLALPRSAAAGERMA